MKDKILEVLNSKREFLMERMFYGMYIDYKELLFQIDEEIRKILKGSDSNG